MRKLFTCLHSASLDKWVVYVDARRLAWLFEILWAKTILGRLLKMIQLVDWQFYHHNNFSYLLQVWTIESLFFLFLYWHLRKIKKCFYVIFSSKLYNFKICLKLKTLFARYTNEWKFRVKRVISFWKPIILKTMRTSSFVHRYAEWRINWFLWHFVLSEFNSPKQAGMEHLCHERNGQWNNPSTQKRPMAVSRGKLSMDVTPYPTAKSHH